MSERIQKNPIEEELAVWAEEREVQIDLLCRYGFHKELGLSAQDYAATIPAFSVQPEEYKNRFDGQLVVEGRIPLPRQHQLANIEEWTDAGRIKNITPVPLHHGVPRVNRYWMHEKPERWGVLTRGKKII